MASSGSSRRPRLFLQTKPTPGPNTRSSKSSLANVNPRSPTAFNTLSNVYVTAIERSTPVQSTPLTAINLHQPLKLQTDPESLRGHQQRVQTPFTATLPDTPLSANPRSPSQHMDIIFPSTMTATPPMSAGSEPKMFTFASNDSRKQAVPPSPSQNYRRMANATLMKAPYSHNRSLHSILRNSPLPPSSSKSPISPRRQSLRLQEKAARRVGYESPLTQTITTEKYTKSHIELLAEDASPYTPSPIAEDDDSDMVLDLAMAAAAATYAGGQGEEETMTMTTTTRDGGQTPGPFEEMRRRMAGLRAGTPVLLSPRPEGVRKRRRKEKKRKWVWTIGQEEDDDDDEENEKSGALRTALTAAAAAEASTPRAAVPEPLTAVQVSVEPDATDVEMSDTDADADADAGSAVVVSGGGGVAVTQCDSSGMDLDLDQKTPTVSTAPDSSILVRPQADRLGSVDLDPAGEDLGTGTGTGKRRDTPIPPDLANHEREEEEERNL
ncbi:hypothetical protein F4809DRAFT_138377 [Biscogniauxia mediterranea]|nr:hypothetical protein F4809DRAFT_138377 [Biscogniauxia mediterranea]